MRTTLLALTTAVAVGALATPIGASAAQHSVGGSMGGSTGHMSTFSGGNAGPQNFNTSGNMGNWQQKNWSKKNWSGPGQTWSSPGKTWSGKNWNGQKFVSDGRHHRHHRNFGVVPFIGFDDYAYADSCWDYVWTPAGYERVYICGGPGYAYYNY